MDETGSEQQKPDFSSAYTQDLPDILQQLGISLAVSTYQAGKLILVRENEGNLNTHFKLFKKPMGVAAQNNRLCIGSQNEIQEFRNMPSVANKLQPSNKHDAVFIPRQRHTTGDIDIHEMAFADDGKLWFANTRFSCLCTHDVDHSFVPKWRPPFVSAYAPEDRCHLNGLAMRNGRPRYVTMLGKTNSKGGWRENKKDGGLLMDISDNRIICEGLSMPHSPRWHNGELWVLESGKGQISKVNEQTGKVTAVATLPGFTRGIDFAAGLAFIGLSQVRESATFCGLPLTESDQERFCGVWVVELKTGKTLGFLRFNGSVQEIFSVQILPHTRFPELLENNDPLINSSYVIPDECLAEVDYSAIKQAQKKPANESNPDQQNTNAAYNSYSNE